MRMNGGYLFRVCCSNRADRCHLFAETQRQLSKIYVIACLSLAILTASSLLHVGRVGFSWWRLLSWQSRNSGRTGSSCVVCGLSCPAACGNFPDQGSPALAGRFLTTREALKGSFIVKKREGFRYALIGGCRPRKAGSCQTRKTRHFTSLVWGRPWLAFSCWRRAGSGAESLKTVVFHRP